MIFCEALCIPIMQSQKCIHWYGFSEPEMNSWCQLGKFQWNCSGLWLNYWNKYASTVFYFFSFPYPIFKMLGDNLPKNAINIMYILNNRIIKIMARKIQSIIKLFVIVHILENDWSSSVQWIFIIVPAKNFPC